MAEIPLKVCPPAAPAVEAQGTSTGGQDDPSPISSGSTAATSTKALGSPTQKDTVSTEISPAEDPDHRELDLTLSHRFTLRKPSFRDVNPFQYTPEQLAKLHDPKDLKALDDLGGIEGLAFGLRTRLEDGLSPDEDTITLRNVNEVTTVKGKERENSKLSKATTMRPTDTIPKLGETYSVARRISTFLPHHEESEPFKDRRRIFGSNTIPPRKPKTILYLMWAALHDKILVDPPRIEYDNIRYSFALPQLCPWV